MTTKSKSHSLSSTLTAIVVIGCAVVTLAISLTSREIGLRWLRKLGFHGERSLEGPSDVAAHIERFAAVLADPARPLSQRIGAGEVVRLVAVLPGATDAARFGDELTAQFATILDADPTAHAALACAVDAARSESWSVERDGVSESPASIPLASWLESALALDPENGIYPVYAAEAALKNGRVEEAIDLLALAAESPRVDPYLRERHALAREALIEAGLLRVTADDHLTRDRYARPSNGPGDALQSVARALGRSLLEDRESSDREWSSIYASLKRIGQRLAARTLLVEDAHYALMAADAYLSELAPSLIGGANRGDSSRRRAAESALRDAGFGELVLALRQDARASDEFIQSALRRASEASQTLDRTERADALVHAQAVLPAWILGFSLVGLLAFAFGRRRLETGRRFAPDSVLRMFAFTLPGFVLLAWIAKGIAPFDGGKGIEGLLYGFAHPTLPLLALPLVTTLTFLVRTLLEARVLREPIGVVARLRARSLAAISLLAVQFLLVIFAVTARSTDGVLTWRSQGLDALRVEHYASLVDRMIDPV